LFVPGNRRLGFEVKKTGKTSNESKRRWDEAHYTQIKANVDHETAEAFKSACRAEGVSTASVLSNFMKEYAGIVRMRRDKPANDTRRKRRKELAALILHLECLLAAEAASVENSYYSDTSIKPTQTPR
jgi:2,3-bisphosphoglycerate-independent phosphoglycerate mutase